MPGTACSSVHAQNQQLYAEKLLKAAAIRRLTTAQWNIKHIPYIGSKHKMAIWSDVKEILFPSCINPKCDVVLNAFKHRFNYPESEDVMHECTLAEQQQFLRLFQSAPSETLLVDLSYFLKDKTLFMELSDAVVLKHQRSKDPNTVVCNELRTNLIAMQEQKQQMAEENELVLEEAEGYPRILPALQRQLESESDKYGLNNNNDTELEPSSITMDTHITNSSKFDEDVAKGLMIPCQVLQKFFPFTEEYLYQIARRFTLGKCTRSRSTTVRCCTEEEAKTVTKFLFSATGQSMRWKKLTSLSLLLSWSQFLGGLKDKMKSTPALRDVSFIVFKPKLKKQSAVAGKDEETGRTFEMDIVSKSRGRAPVCRKGVLKSKAKGLLQSKTLPAAMETASRFDAELVGCSVLGMKQKTKPDQTAVGVDKFKRMEKGDIGKKPVCVSVPLSKGKPVTVVYADGKFVTGGRHDDEAPVSDKQIIATDIKGMENLTLNSGNLHQEMVIKDVEHISDETFAKMKCNLEMSDLTMVSCDDFEQKGYAFRSRNSNNSASETSVVEIPTDKSLADSKCSRGGDNIVPGDRTSANEKAYSVDLTHVGQKKQSQTESADIHQTVNCNPYCSGHNSTDFNAAKCNPASRSRPHVAASLKQRSTSPGQPCQYRTFPERKTMHPKPASANSRCSSATNPQSKVVWNARQNYPATASAVNSEESSASPRVPGKDFSHSSISRQQAQSAGERSKFLRHCRPIMSVGRHGKVYFTNNQAGTQKQGFQTDNTRLWSSYSDRPSGSMYKPQVRWNTTNCSPQSNRKGMTTETPVVPLYTSQVSENGQKNKTPLISYSKGNGANLMNQSKSPMAQLREHSKSLTPTGNSSRGTPSNQRGTSRNTASPRDSPVTGRENISSQRGTPSRGTPTSQRSAVGLNMGFTSAQSRNDFPSVPEPSIGEKVNMIAAKYGGNMQLSSKKMIPESMSVPFRIAHKALVHNGVTTEKPRWNRGTVVKGSAYSAEAMSAGKNRQKEDKTPVHKGSGSTSRDSTPTANFGTSMTRDLYEEFARIRKPRQTKPETIYTPNTGKPTRNLSPNTSDFPKSPTKLNTEIIQLKQRYTFGEAALKGLPEQYLAGAVTTTESFENVNKENRGLEQEEKGIVEEDLEPCVQTVHSPECLLALSESNYRNFDGISNRFNEDNNETHHTDVDSGPVATQSSASACQQTSQYKQPGLEDTRCIRPSVSLESLENLSNLVNINPMESVSIESVRQNSAPPIRKQGRQVSFRYSSGQEASPLWDRASSTGYIMKSGENFVTWQPVQQPQEGTGSDPDVMHQVLYSCPSGVIIPNLHSVAPISVTKPPTNSPVTPPLFYRDSKTSNVHLLTWSSQIPPKSSFFYSPQPGQLLPVTQPSPHGICQVPGCNQTIANPKPRPYSAASVFLKKIQEANNLKALSKMTDFMKLSHSESERVESELEKTATEDVETEREAEEHQQEEKYNDDSSTESTMTESSTSCASPDTDQGIIRVDINEKRKESCNNDQLLDSVASTDSETGSKKQTEQKSQNQSGNKSNADMQKKKDFLSMYSKTKTGSKSPVTQRKASAKNSPRKSSAKSMTSISSVGKTQAAKKVQIVFDNTASYERRVAHGVLKRTNSAADKKSTGNNNRSDSPKEKLQLSIKVSGLDAQSQEKKIKKSEPAKYSVEPVHSYEIVESRSSELFRKSSSTNSQSKSNSDASVSNLEKERRPRLFVALKRIDSKPKQPRSPYSVNSPRTDAKRASPSRVKSSKSKTKRDTRTCTSQQSVDENVLSAMAAVKRKPSKNKTSESRLHSAGSRGMVRQKRSIEKHVSQRNRRSKGLRTKSKSANSKSKETDSTAQRPETNVNEVTCIDGNTKTLIGLQTEMSKVESSSLSSKKITNDLKPNHTTGPRRKRVGNYTFLTDTNVNENAESLQRLSADRGKSITVEKSTVSQKTETAKIEQKNNKIQAVGNDKPTANQTSTEICEKDHENNVFASLESESKSQSSSVKLQTLIKGSADEPDSDSGLGYTDIEENDVQRSRQNSTRGFKKVLQGTSEKKEKKMSEAKGGMEMDNGKNKQTNDSKTISNSSQDQIIEKTGLESVQYDQDTHLNLVTSTQDFTDLSEQQNRQDDEFQLTLDEQIAAIDQFQYRTRTLNGMINDEAAIEVMYDIGGDVVSGSAFIPVVNQEVVTETEDVYLNEYQERDCDSENRKECQSSRPLELPEIVGDEATTGLSSVCESTGTTTSAAENSSAERVCYPDFQDAGVQGEIIQEAEDIPAVEALVCDNGNDKPIICINKDMNVSQAFLNSLLQPDTEYVSVVRRDGNWVFVPTEHSQLSVALSFLHQETQADFSKAKESSQDQINDTDQQTTQMVRPEEYFEVGQVQNQESEIYIDNTELLNIVEIQDGALSENLQATVKESTNNGIVESAAENFVEQSVECDIDSEDTPAEDIEIRKILAGCERSGMSASIPCHFETTGECGLDNQECCTDQEHSIEAQSIDRCQQQHQTNILGGSSGCVEDVSVVEHTSSEKKEVSGGKDLYTDSCSAEEGNMEIPQKPSAEMAQNDCLAPDVLLFNSFPVCEDSQTGVEVLCSQSVESGIQCPCVSPVLSEPESENKKLSHRDIKTAKHKDSMKNQMPDQTEFDDSYMQTGVDDLDLSDDLELSKSDTTSEDDEDRLYQDYEPDWLQFLNCDGEAEGYQSGERADCSQKVIPKQRDLSTDIVKHLDGISIADLLKVSEKVSAVNLKSADAKDNGQQRSERLAPVRPINDRDPNVFLKHWDAVYPRNNCSWNQNRNKNSVKKVLDDEKESKSNKNELEGEAESNVEQGISEAERMMVMSVVYKSKLRNVNNFHNLPDIEEEAMEKDDTGNGNSEDAANKSKAPITRKPSTGLKSCKQGNKKKTDSDRKAKKMDSEKEKPSGDDYVTNDIAELSRLMKDFNQKNLQSENQLKNKDVSDTTKNETSKTKLARKDKVVKKTFSKISKVRESRRNRKDHTDVEMDESERNRIAAEGFIKTQQKYLDIIRKQATESQVPSSDQQQNQGEGTPRSSAQENVQLDTETQEFVEKCANVSVNSLTKYVETPDPDANMADSDDEDESSDPFVAMTTPGIALPETADAEQGIQYVPTEPIYQMIEDEDGSNLGGIAFYKHYIFPFVYINGYKFITIRDALTCFNHCVSACTIPRSVLKQHKGVVRSFCTWDQVYKLELIKMKKGHSIKTGDMLVKLDCLISLLPELRSIVADKHKNTNLKRSKQCRLQEMLDEWC